MLRGNGQRLDVGCEVMGMSLKVSLDVEMVQLRRKGISGGWHA
jgi:hypothetical protein